MRHRHLIDPGMTLAAIDDIIENGDVADWIALRDGCADPDIRAKAYKVARARSASASEDASFMRHACWLNHLQLEYGLAPENRDAA